MGFNSGFKGLKDLLIKLKTQHNYSCMLNIFTQQNSNDRNSNFLDKGNHKVTPILAKKPYKGSRCTESLIPNIRAR